MPGLQPYIEGPLPAEAVWAPAPIRPTLIEPFEAAARGWRAEVLHAGSHDWPQAVARRAGPAGLHPGGAGRRWPAARRLGACIAGCDAAALCTAAGRRVGRPNSSTPSMPGSPAWSQAWPTPARWCCARGRTSPAPSRWLPPVHVAVLRASTLYAGLPSAMRALSPQADMPTNLLLITGPSKTADIQQTLAYGAHGPNGVGDRAGARPARKHWSPIMSTAVHPEARTAAAASHAPPALRRSAPLQGQHPRGGGRCAPAPRASAARWTSCRPSAPRTSVP